MRTLFRKTGIKYLMLIRRLENIYQQWQQDNPDYVNRYMDFVKIVSRINNTSDEESLRLLESTYWFRKPNNFPRFG